jgi:Zn-dependent peptidase ImmA (M78 family)
MALDEQIIAVLDETGEHDPRDAIRTKARHLVELFHTTFGSTPPFNMEAMASLRGIRPSSDAPTRSADAELRPDGKGGVLLRLNRDRPRTRQRFSIGHEITHTFFPGYEDKVQCRKPKNRDWSDPEDVIEVLCDIGASELLFPRPWFPEDARRLARGAEGMAQLAADYQGSLEATLRRLVDLDLEPTAAVCFRWKLKPAQRHKGVGRKDQPGLFGDDLQDEAKALMKLRVEYALASEGFGLHIPREKSVESAGVIFDASVRNVCLDAEEELDLGPCRGRFRISAIPVFTDDQNLGPNGEKAVFAVLRPATTPRAGSEAVPPLGL